MIFYRIIKNNQLQGKILKAFAIRVVFSIMISFAIMYFFHPEYLAEGTIALAVLMTGLSYIKEFFGDQKK